MDIINVLCYIFTILIYAESQCGIIYILIIGLKAFIITYLSVYLSAVSLSVCLLNYFEISFLFQIFTRYIFQQNLKYLCVSFSRNLIHKITKLVFKVLFNGFDQLFMIHHYQYSLSMQFIFLLLFISYQWIINISYHYHHQCQRL